MGEAPLILAFDISKSRTGIAEGRPGETPRCYSVSGAGLETTQAVVKLGRWLIEKTGIDKPDWIFYEAAIPLGAFKRVDPVTGEERSTSNPQTTVTIAKMCGVVEFIADMRDIPLRTAHVQTVRKSFINAGNLRKDEAERRTRALCQLLGWNASNHDEADALAVWHHACVKVAPQQATFISPLLQARCANRIGSSDIEDASKLFRRESAR